ncbi:patatin-like phospholipase family protein [bacterium]|nr:patatin-like phospholipase family protein [bacterium]
MYGKVGVRGYPEGGSSHRSLEPSAGGDPLADVFDLVAGTSTGGIIVCLVLCPDPDNPSRPRHDAKYAANLYRERGAEIFSRGWFHRLRTLGGLLDEKYPAAGLERVLADSLGTARLSSLLLPTLIPAYDIHRRRAVMFCSHAAARDPAEDFSLTAVARATSAAPTYFEAYRATAGDGARLPLVDGGVFANNPALCAYAEAGKLPGGPRPHEMAILSLGTGTAMQAYRWRDARRWGLAQWALPLVSIVATGLGETVDYQLAKIFAGLGCPECYLRLQADIATAPPGTSSNMDNTTPENLDRLRAWGRETAWAREAELRRFARLLLGKEGGRAGVGAKPA